MVRHHHRIAPAIALTLALAATAAPAASADPAPLAQAEAAIANASPGSQPSSGLCSEVCSGGGYGSLKTTATNPTYTGLCSEVCSSGGYGSLTTPASMRDVSGAALPHDPRPRAEVISGDGSGSANSTAASRGSTGPRSEVVSGGGYGSPAVPSTMVRVVAPSGGFDWGDAGIGAGGAVALMMLLFGGVLTATRLRRPRSSSSAQPTT